MEFRLNLEKNEILVLMLHNFATSVSLIGARWTIPKIKMSEFRIWIKIAVVFYGINRLKTYLKLHCQVGVVKFTRKDNISNPCLISVYQILKNQKWMPISRVSKYPFIETTQCFLSIHLFLDRPVIILKCL